VVTFDRHPKDQKADKHRHTQRRTRASPTFEPEQPPFVTSLTSSRKASSTRRGPRCQHRRPTRAATAESSEESLSMTERARRGKTHLRANRLGLAGACGTRRCNEKSAADHYPLKNPTRCRPASALVVVSRLSLSIAATFVEPFAAFGSSRAVWSSSGGANHCEAVVRRRHLFKQARTRSARYVE